LPRHHVVLHSTKNYLKKDVHFMKSY